MILWHCRNKLWRLTHAPSFLWKMVSFLPRYHCWQCLLSYLPSMWCSQRDMLFQWQLRELGDGRMHRYSTQACRQQHCHCLQQLKQCCCCSVFASSHRGRSLLLQNMATVQMHVCACMLGDVMSPFAAPINNQLRLMQLPPTITLCRWLAPHTLSYWQLSVCTRHIVEM